MDILSYVMGMKSAAAGGGSTGGDNAVRITMSWDSGSECYVLDKTYEEMKSLITEGKLLYVTGTYSGAVMFLTMDDENNGLFFASIPRGAGGSGTAYSVEMSVGIDNSVITYNTQIVASTHEDGD